VNTPWSELVALHSWRWRRGMRANDTEMHVLTWQWGGVEGGHPEHLGDGGPREEDERVRLTAAVAAMWSASLILASMSRRQWPRRGCASGRCPACCCRRPGARAPGARWPGVRTEAELRRWRGPHHVSSSVRRKKIGERLVWYPMEWPYYP
jgi:hypothetical protein